MLFVPSALAQPLDSMAAGRYGGHLVTIRRLTMAFEASPDGAPVSETMMARVRR